MQLVVIDFNYIFVLTLHCSLALGLLNEWVNVLYIEIWLLWFLLHVLVCSVYAIFVDLILKQDLLRRHLLYHFVGIALWYYQHVLALTHQNVENYELGCKRDLLVLTTTSSFTIFLMAAGASVFTLVA